MSVRSESVKEFVLEKATKHKKGKSALASIDRSVGKLTYGILECKAEKKLRLYMHPPSIPTRFQTIHYDDGESKGFSSTSKRFTYRLNDLPGRLLNGVEIWLVANPSSSS